MQPFRFVCFWFYKLSKLAGRIFFYGFVIKLNCINQTCYLNFKLKEEHLLMVIYFKKLTTKIPNIYRNSLNRNVYLKNQSFWQAFHNFMVGPGDSWSRWNVYPTWSLGIYFFQKNLNFEILKILFNSAFVHSVARCIFGEHGVFPKLKWRLIMRAKIKFFLLLSSSLKEILKLLSHLPREIRQELKY